MNAAVSSDVLSSLVAVILFLIFFLRNSFVCGCAGFSGLHISFCLLGLRGGESLLVVCRRLIGAEHGL